ncbi:MAG: prolyl oligopeptidase family serine peptidase, partial [Caldimonas sp.]
MSPRTPGRAVFTAGVASAMLLAGCTALQPPRDLAIPEAAPSARTAGLIAPNANLFVQGIPPIPASVAADVVKYTDFRGHRFVDWHPTKREMLVAYRKAGGDTTQIFRLASPLAEPEALTDFAEPVRNASYEPVRGDYIVFERGTGGDEAAQLYRLDLASRQSTLLTDPTQRHDMQAWLHRSSQLLFLSVPLDRTAAGRSRAAITQTLTLFDPARPEAKRRLAELPGGGWGVGGVSWDDRKVALTRYVSAAESQIWLLDLASGDIRQLLPSPSAAAAPVASHFGNVWKRDDSGFFFVSDRSGEFQELMFYRLADGAISRVSRSIPWDIVSASLDASGRLLAVRANVEGRKELRFFDADTFGELPSPALPAGSVIESDFHRRLPVLAVTLSDSKGPAQVGLLDPATGALQRWTAPYSPPGVDTASFGRQEIVRWKSFDGREISGIVNRPPARFAGKRPVLVDIHGGPESQAEFGFMGRANYLFEELGIAMIRPNVRGSSGFGKTFLSLDDGMKREDSVKDIGALLDWIATQPGLDASRVMVSGG